MYAPAFGDVGGRVSKPVAQASACPKFYLLFPRPSLFIGSDVGCCGAGAAVVVFGCVSEAGWFAQYSYFLPSILRPPFGPSVSLTMPLVPSVRFVKFSQNSKGHG
jgi:hypothetical protein